MNDMEKVIKGLQCIIDGTIRCESCGYAIDKHGHHSCHQKCAKEAIAMLKEQDENIQALRETVRNLILQIQDIAKHKDAKIESLERTIEDICCGG